MRTVDSRGKSLIPWSRIEIELSRSCSEDFKDCTEAESELALEYDMIVEFWLLQCFIVEVLQQGLVAQQTRRDVNRRARCAGPGSDKRDRWFASTWVHELNLDLRLSHIRSAQTDQKSKEAHYSLSFI